jgi:hypothetical protein
MAVLMREALAKPLRGVCKREVRIQESGVRIIVHVARERVPVLNTEALAKPLWGVCKREVRIQESE